MSTVEVSGISKSFGLLTAVNDVSFTVESGSCTALLGPSGCGTTTTLRMIAGFETPDAGRIALAGRDMTDKRPYERNVGLVFQDYALFPHMSVAENLAYGMRHRGVAKSEIPERVRRRLAQVKLSGYEDRRPSKLSGGEQQRVALARALATEPEVLLLDEPLSNLDAKLRQELRGELKSLLETVGTTTMIVTHDQEEAMGLASRIVVMNRGRVEQIGAPREIYDRPRTRFVAEFMGRSNWFVGRLERRPGDSGLLFCGEAGVSFAIDDADELQGPVDLAIRPEQLEIVDADAPQALAGRVATSEYLGSKTHVTVQLDSGSLLLVIFNKSGRGDAVVGDRIGVRVPRDGCILLPRSGPAPMAPA